MPGLGSRSMRSSSACPGSSHANGQTWNPRQPRLTAHTTCAMSAMTSASTSCRSASTPDRLQPVRRACRHALLEEGLRRRRRRGIAAASPAGRPRAEDRLRDGEVVRDQIELGRPGRGRTPCPGWRSRRCGPTPPRSGWRLGCLGSPWRQVIGALTRPRLVVSVGRPGELPARQLERWTMSETTRVMTSTITAL